MTLFKDEAILACAADMRIKIPEYKIDGFLKGKMRNVRDMVEAARARTDCVGPNIDAAIRLKRFADAFESLNDADFKDISDWKKFVGQYVPSGWEKRLSFDDVLGNFGFEDAFARALRKQTVEVTDGKVGTTQTVTWEHQGLRWVGKSLGGFKPAGCLTDVVNLVFAMKGYTPAQIDAGLSATDIGRVIRQFTQHDLRDSTKLWVPTHLLVDCESDDMLAWCVVETINKLNRTQLAVLAQLPEDSEADRIQEFLSSRMGRNVIVFRDPQSRNMKALSQYWAPILARAK